MKKLILLSFALCFMRQFCIAQREFANAEWQWSVSVNSIISSETNNHPEAFLWIPPNCEHVRGVVVGQHNMIEEGIFENPAFRKTLSDLNFAVVWTTPAINQNFDFNTRVGDYFDAMMRKLADSSGYDELATAPIVPIGHSALATYPWNFAAWNPARTLAVLSIHGDAPQTKLTGYGKANVDWGNRTIEGVPGLFVMGEYEWWEKRIEPGFDYVNKYPKTPITFFADAGHGHFDYSDELIDYIGLFLRKVAKYRLPPASINNKETALIPIDPAKGWLMDRWHKDSLPTAKAAPYKDYKGNKATASWVFDEEHAKATEAYYARVRSKQPQHIGLEQNGKILKPSPAHANYNLAFNPEKDGITFHIKAFFADTSRMIPTDNHASTHLFINRICGPVMKVDDTTFRLRFYRMGFDNPKRSSDIWLLAMNKGDDHYKSIVQQMDLHFPLINKQGKEQQITFPLIPNQKKGVASIPLQAKSSADVPVYYYVKEGPAVIEGDKLVFTKIPPRTKFPLKVTVVAWQYGTAIEPKLQTATPVERSFYIN
jgi:hypothetical protein